jgi:hypothetical protein
VLGDQFRLKKKAEIKCTFVRTQICKKNKSECIKLWNHIKLSLWNMYEIRNQESYVKCGLATQDLYSLGQ